MNQEELQERVNKAADAIVGALTDVGIPQVESRKFAEKFTLHFIERATWTKESMIELGVLEKEHIGKGMDIWSVVANVCKPLCMGYAERVRYFLNESKDDLSEDDAKQLQDDLEAMHEYEMICPCDDACPITEEHRNLFTVLVQGIEPQYSWGRVTQEEVEQFRKLAPKFGISGHDLELRIARETIGGRVEDIIKKQKVVDERMERNRLALERQHRPSANKNRFFRSQ